MQKTELFCKAAPIHIKYLCWFDTNFVSYNFIQTSILMIDLRRSKVSAHK